jgi:hypothetical protein
MSLRPGSLDRLAVILFGPAAVCQEHLVDVIMVLDKLWPFDVLSC